jgi:hypothetical protein
MNPTEYFEAVGHLSLIIITVEARSATQPNVIHELSPYGMLGKSLRTTQIIG